MKFPVLSALCPVLMAASVLLCGCGTDYRWSSSVPEGARTVSVPTFRNESEVVEAGALASRQVIREFQREGTFTVRTNGDAALEIQGVVKQVNPGLIAYDRRHGGRVSACSLLASVEVSVIDKRTRKVLIDNRKYTAETTFTSGVDQTTGIRNASGRLMDDLSRKVVDDVLNLKL